MTWTALDALLLSFNFQQNRLRIGGDWLWLCLASLLGVRKTKCPRSLAPSAARWSDKITDWLLNTIVRTYCFFQRVYSCILLANIRIMVARKPRVRRAQSLGFWRREDWIDIRTCQYQLWRLSLNLSLVKTWCHILNLVVCLSDYKGLQLSRSLRQHSTGLHLVNKPSSNNNEAAGTVTELDLLESHRNSTACGLPFMCIPRFQDASARN